MVTDTRAGDMAGSVPSARDIFSRELALGFTDRLLLRGLAFLASRQVRAIHGLRHIDAANDPFILAINHSIRREAVLVPALLFLHRNGRPIHFFVDWNFRLWPGLGTVLSRAGTITVTRKPARPAFLNLLQPLYRDRVSPMERARQHLRAGRPVGIFPEGTVNRDPQLLMPPRLGMARLALDENVPVVPVGIRFPDGTAGAARERAAMEVFIGAPLHPEAGEGRARLADVRAFSARVMDEIARLSGKELHPRTMEVRHA